MPYPSEMAHKHRREMRYRDQITGELLNGNAEVHSSTRMHLIKVSLCRLTGEYLMKRPIDAVLLSRDTHNKLHYTANTHEKHPDAQYARPETVHKITWEALNLANWQFTDILISKSKALNGGVLLDSEYNRIKKIVDSKYSIPYSINENKKDVMASYREDGQYYLESIKDSYKYLTQPPLAEAGD